MKTCIHCGAELPDDARFCHKCAHAQGRRQKASGPFPWRKAAALFLPALTLVYLLGVFRRPAGAPPIPEESLAPTKTMSPGARWKRAQYTRVTTTEEEGPTYHSTSTYMRNTLIEATFTYPNGNVNQVFFWLDGTHRAEYMRRAETIEYLEFYPDGSWSFHVNGDIGYGATAFSYGENGNITDTVWASDVVSYIEERRLKVEDVIEEYTQEILDNWDDSPP